ncbi:primase-helicase family protein [Bradyrhizobium sp. UFLA05-153]
MKKKPDINETLQAEGAEAVRERLDAAHRKPVSLDDFHAFMPAHNYIYAPSREPWPGSSVNARIPPIQVGTDDEGEPIKINASTWLDQNKPVEQMTWAPGLEMIIPDRLVSAGGWIERRGVSCFNLYRPPQIIRGNAAKASVWLDHVRKVFGEEQAAHIIAWLAHRVQRPQEKINHALVLGGAQGVGKDTLLEPAKYAVGPWNFTEVTPMHLLGRFNGFVKSVILRISEARDLGDVNRFAFYDHMKSYCASPPDVLRVDEKNLREHSVLNCCGVIITTNHKADGIFLPADDRRHYVAWSDAEKETFAEDYWPKLWGWYEYDGGYGHVAAYLAALDISTFDAKAPPPKTPAFWDVVDANRAPENAELADVLDQLGNPNALTLATVQKKAEVLTVDGVDRSDFKDWINDRRHRRQLPHRFEQCGYVPVRNDAAKDGLWKIKGARQVVYAKASMSVSERLSAAQRLTGNCGDQGQI